MNSHPDHRRHEHALAAVERRLERLSAAAPPQLRHRVLMAVDDVLAEQRPTVQGGTGGAVPGWAWTAAAAMLLLGLSLVAGTRPVRPFEPLTLAARLRVAGVADEDLLAAAGTMRLSDAVVGAAGRDDRVSTMPTANRLIDVRTLLEESL